MKLKRRWTFVCFRFYVLCKSPKSLATKSIIGYNYNVCVIEMGEISKHSSIAKRKFYIAINAGERYPLLKMPQSYTNYFTDALSFDDLLDAYI